MSHKKLSKIKEKEIKFYRMERTVRRGYYAAGIERLKRQQSLTETETLALSLHIKPKNVLKALGMSGSLPNPQDENHRTFDSTKLYNRLQKREKRKYSIAGDSAVEIIATCNSGNALPPLNNQIEEICESSLKMNEGKYTDQRECKFNTSNIEVDDVEVKGEEFDFIPIINTSSDNGNNHTAVISETMDNQSFDMDKDKKMMISRESRDVSISDGKGNYMMRLEKSAELNRLGIGSISTSFPKSNSVISNNSIYAIPLTQQLPGECENSESVVSLNGHNNRLHVGNRTLNIVNEGGFSNISKIEKNKNDSNLENSHRDISLKDHSCKAKIVSFPSNDKSGYEICESTSLFDIAELLNAPPNESVDLSEELSAMGNAHDRADRMHMKDDSPQFSNDNAQELIIQNEGSNEPRNIEEQKEFVEEKPKHIKKKNVKQKLRQPKNGRNLSSDDLDYLKKTGLPEFDISGGFRAFTASLRKSKIKGDGSCNSRRRLKDGLSSTLRRYETKDFEVCFRRAKIQIASLETNRKELLSIKKDQADCISQLKKMNKKYEHRIEILKKKLIRLQKVHKICRRKERKAMYITEDSILSPAQLKMLNGKSIVTWSEEDILKAQCLKAISEHAYNYVREVLCIPLPGKGTINKRRKEAFPGQAKAVYETKSSINDNVDEEASPFDNSDTISCPTLLCVNADQSNQIENEKTSKNRKKRKLGVPPIPADMDELKSRISKYKANIIPSKFSRFTPPSQKIGIKGKRIKLTEEEIMQRKRDGTWGKRGPRKRKNIIDREFTAIDIQEGEIADMPKMRRRRKFTRKQFLNEEEGEFITIDPSSIDLGKYDYQTVISNTDADELIPQHMSHTHTVQQYVHSATSNAPFVITYNTHQNGIEQQVEEDPAQYMIHDANLHGRIIITDEMRDRPVTPIEHII